MDEFPDLTSAKNCLLVPIFAQMNESVIPFSFARALILSISTSHASFAVR
nr:MAG TPA: hypothetical protein [Caudoviricetes sp.]